MVYPDETDRAFSIEDLLRPKRGPTNPRPCGARKGTIIDKCGSHSIIACNKIDRLVIEAVQNIRYFISDPNPIQTRTGPN